MTDGADLCKLRLDSALATAHNVRMNELKRYAQGKQPCKLVWSTWKPDDVESSSCSPVGTLLCVLAGPALIVP